MPRLLVASADTGLVHRLRDAGLEVVIVPPLSGSEHLAAVAVQEDVVAVVVDGGGAGDAARDAEACRAALAARGADDVTVFTPSDGVEDIVDRVG